MKNKKVNSILLCTAFVSFILFLFSFFSEDGNSVKAVKSALVNPADGENIHKIIISSPSEVLTLQKEKKFWTCERGEACAFADEKNVLNLIKNLVKLRNMYKISDSIDGRSELGLVEGSAQIITVAGSDGHVFSKLYFGSSDALTSRITVASERGKACYETEDDFSVFLKTDLNFWSVPEIFFAIKNPSNLTLSPEDLHLLLSLRHGQFFGFEPVPREAVFEKSVALYGQYDSFQKVDFYSLLQDGEILYLYTQTVGGEEKLCNAVFEVSRWTFERLNRLLGE
ncbi:MAG: hypothetical protein PUE30_06035 [Spirochaetia bacterium]|nr:hypothetical protein [Spirochaetia bacterium]